MTPDELARKQFPILDHCTFKFEKKFHSLPWDMLAPHAKQAEKNHSQTLERLAERGGLSYKEAYCVINDLYWNATTLTDQECHDKLLIMLNDYELDLYIKKKEKEAE